MTAGSMTALMGASSAQRLTSIPMNAYSAAERKGDTAAMERAMGYARGCTAQALDYSKKAREELAEEQRVQRREQRREQEGRLSRKGENAVQSGDSLEISGGAKNQSHGNNAEDETVSPLRSSCAVYTPSGNAVSIEHTAAAFDERA